MSIKNRLPKRQPNPFAIEPRCGWHEDEVYSVNYPDIEILIDRQTDREVEIRVWRNGKDDNYPYLKVTFTIDDLDISQLLKTVEAALAGVCDHNLRKTLSTDDPLLAYQQGSLEIKIKQEGN
jgi:hypothetical protein